MEQWMKALLIVVLGISLLAGAVVAVEDTATQGNTGTAPTLTSTGDIAAANPKLPKYGGTYAGYKGYVKGAVADRLSGKRAAAAEKVKETAGRAAVRQEVKAAVTKAAGKSGACMQTAVENRDSAIIKAVGTFSSGMTSALSTRKDALKAAWAIEDPKERSSALTAAWDAFRGSWKKAGAQMKADREAAWREYLTYVRNNCGAVDKTESADNSAFDILPAA